MSKQELYAVEVGLTSKSHEAVALLAGEDINQFAQAAVIKLAASEQGAAPQVLAAEAERQAAPTFSKKLEVVFEGPSLEALRYLSESKTTQGTLVRFALLSAIAQQAHESPDLNELEDALRNKPSPGDSHRYVRRRPGNR